MDISSFREVFAAEARDYLQSLNEDLLEFERNPQDQGTVDDMFRAAHSLKGMAGTMGFDELAEFTHEMESVLDLLRTGELQLTTEVINVLFRSVDTLELLLEQTISEEPISPYDEQVRSLKALIQHASLAPPPTTGGEHFSAELNVFNRETIKQGIAQGYQAFSVSVVLRPNTILKSVRVFTVFQALEQVATVIQSNPPIQDLDDEKFDRQFVLVILTKESAHHIRQLVEGIPEIESADVQSISLAEAGEGAEAVEQAAEETAASSDAAVSAAPIRGHRQDPLVRVETERLDKLINLVGELVISRTQVIEMVKGGEATDRMGAVDQLDRITTELQYAAMSLRMVPIKQVFDRFPRMVRDLAQSRGKEINLEIFGETTELDRSIVNQIGDPLVHLIRNSIDHGIEPKEERIAKGKPGAGTIRLNARHEGSYILIEIMDDGKGLDVNRIRDKAVERNLLPEGTKEISMGEAVNLLFQPGFSTAEIVTDLSGRGVGLDAVKAVVESLSGTISVESEPGKSTRTTIKLPLTLAIIKALLVKVDGETVAIPIQAVRENIQIESEQIKTVQQRPVIMLRNEVLPLYDLAQCLGFTPVDTSGPLPVIIVEVRGSKVGFIVEDLIGQQEIVIKSLSGIVGDIKGVAGATILGNGRIALIIDNSTLIG
ncbi:chemotaxis protein CheA [Candidatus Darwinibacter acetoxidans]|jgi:two-component system chemotaxis sensor kinase CheA|nr:chemotaxis protein CheA [Bacillota bacterium]